MPHSGTFLLDAGAAQQRADKSSANAEPKASLLDELDKVNVPERSRGMASKGLRATFLSTVTKVEAEK